MVWTLAGASGAIGSARNEVRDRDAGGRRSSGGSPTGRSGLRRGGSLIGTVRDLGSLIGVFFRVELRITSPQVRNSPAGRRLSM
jgi:hypothetical protein